uniref:N-acetyltransferase domain-containing protein n=1 Tax=Chromera velia CCMP2878 TaxID=1169474 RepID=A0A0G4I2W2_9ALVE|eukprot:Cvel_10506.t1-p1 / transcript=Cvel_10506.t1 / gene=Cvel_10506 / organism=Chromera_velia_CCMP2878 / gene_product=hypothetical protein / transcript_product=hypothetical protein / location=Cvel_scaffold635:45050-47747(+) / protein_length=310 / sequence_SO=supercontig / SO=protein_coding / is_pseudo=false
MEAEFDDFTVVTSRRRGRANPRVQEAKAPAVPPPIFVECPGLPPPSTPPKPSSSALKMKPASLLTAPPSPATASKAGTEAFSSLMTPSTAAPSVAEPLSPSRTESVAGEQQILEEDPDSLLLPVDVATLVKHGILLEDIPVKQPELLDDRTKALLQEVKKLSEDCFEKTDVSQQVSKKTGKRLCVFAAADKSEMFGFLLYRLRGSPLNCLEICNLAVAPRARGLGLGRRLCKWAVNAGKRNPEVSFVTLSSLKEAVGFYSKMGFRADGDVKCAAPLADNEELVEGQVYMEMKVGRPFQAGKSSKGGKKRK